MRALVCTLLVAALCLANCDVTLRVYSDGTGDYSSVQAALDGLAPGKNASLGRVTLHLLGAFWERVHVYSNFSSGGNLGVTMLGVRPSPLAASIAYNVSGAAVGTFNSFTATVDADDFIASNVAFINNADGYKKKEAGQCVALGVTGDRAVLTGVALLGAQDTLYTGANRVYLNNTFVNGSCDSLFGEGAMVLEGCAVAIYDTVTAQKGNGSTSYLFQDCDISPTESETLLGRPWGPLAHTVYKNCAMSANIAKVGWSDWNRGCTNHSAPHACDGVIYAEFNSSGPGAAPDSRVWWSRQLNASEAAGWTASAVLSGWEPAVDPQVVAAVSAAIPWSAKAFARGQV